MNTVILGSTKGMGRALARAMAARGDRLFLLGRNAEDLGRSAADLELRAGAPAGAPARVAGGVVDNTESGAEVGIAVCDLARPASFEAALDAAQAALGRIDTVVVTAGVFASQEALENDSSALQNLLTINFAHTVLFCEAARRRLLLAGGGTLCVFGSVAGDRGRKPVVLYGAAKAGLAAYLEGLDHRFRAAGLRTVTVKPGFVHTGMTAGLSAPPFAGQPEDVAKRVLRAIDRGTPVVYAPAIWRWVMLVIRWLPRIIMRRIGF
jgi:short-subunit dehydrogenase